MLLPATSFLFISVTKSGQTPRKGAKLSAQKNTKKQLHPAKVIPKTEKQDTEVERIIQAAEKYHQQITGKKAESAVENKKKTEPAIVKKISTVSKPLKSQTADVKKVSPVSKPLKSQIAESKDNYSDKDLNVNIYTGNPGYYQSEGDTLNFWSFAPVPVDSLKAKATVAEQPGKPYGFEGKPMKVVAQDWSFFLVVIGWMIFASLRFGFSKYIVQVFQSIFNYSASARLYREQGYNNQFGLFWLNLIFYLFVPFSIYLIARDNGVSLMGSSGIEFYLIVFVVINAYFLLKIVLYKIMGSIFSKREPTGELVFNMMLYHNVLGMIMLPVATMHAMVPVVGLISLFLVPGLIVLFYLMSIIRSLFFAFREGISIFYLILYLCALEILPILLVAKLATNG